MHAEIRNAQVRILASSEISDSLLHGILPHISHPRSVKDRWAKGKGTKEDWEGAWWHIMLVMRAKQLIPDIFVCRVLVFDSVSRRRCFLLCLLRRLPVTQTQITLSRKIFHTPLCHAQTLSHTLFYTPLCNTPPCHTQPFTYNFVTHTTLSRTQLCRTPSFSPSPVTKHSFVMHNFFHA